MKLFSGVNGFYLLGSYGFLLIKQAFFSCYVVMKFHHGVATFHSKYPVFVRTNIPTNTLVIN